MNCPVQVRKFSFVKPRCTVRIGDVGKRFVMLYKELETLSNLRERQSTLPFVDMVFSNNEDLCKNTANTDSVDEANYFFLCKFISCLFYICFVY